MPREQPHLDSLVEVYRGAAWHEREVHELFGVIFDGNPDLRPAAHRRLSGSAAAANHRPAHAGSRPPGRGPSILRTGRPCARVRPLPGRSRRGHVRGCNRPASRRSGIPASGRPRTRSQARDRPRADRPHRGQLHVLHAVRARMPDLVHLAARPIRRRSAIPAARRPRTVNVLDEFTIDWGLCMYCGICVEVCPFEALEWRSVTSVPATSDPLGLQPRDRRAAA